MRIVSWFLLALVSAVPSGATDFPELTEDSSLHGFRTTAVYLDDASHRFGARFQHKKTGFTLDVLRIQSVPQAFSWVNSAPDSDRGEPHTQEHLLLLKGNMGRGLAASESMSLTRSSAFTLQERTCYHFSTTAGAAVFYRQLEHELDALLHPDYTDEEIRREVRNFGVSVTPVSGELRLEEKGSVYNEMVSSSYTPMRILYRELSTAIYGPRHPLAYDAGGDPPAIREMRPEHIRAFHRTHYFLGNMGAIVSLPEEEPLDATLDRIDTLLNRLQPKPDPRPALTEASYPAPEPAAAGSLRVVDFPSQNEQQPGGMGLAWPASRKLSVRELVLVQLFLDAFAGDSTTNLYRLLINGRTRKSDIAPQSVYAYAAGTQGFPIRVGLSLVPAANLTEARLAEFRALVMAELERIRGFADGSPELRELNDRIRSRVIAERRNLAKLVNSPPGFGARNTYDSWMGQLHELNRAPGFEKLVTEKDDLAAIERMLGSGRNVWRDRIPSWRLTGVEPAGVAVRPSAPLLARQRKERQERVEAEANRLVKLYNAADRQAAIRRYRDQYDANTAALDQLAAKAVAAGKFLDDPPLTLDDQLRYRAGQVGGGIPMVASTFANMTGATTALALRLDGVHDDDLVFLSLLPVLLTETGVMENGKPIPYEQMSERLRNDILDLNASFINYMKGGRVELLVRASGNNLAESRRAIEWMRLVLAHPDWRPENLPRIRDLVNQTLGALRSTPQRREEAWVRDPATAYRWQANRHYLATASFLTRAYYADRLRWMLADCGGTTERQALAAWLERLAGAARGKSRAELKALAANPEIGGLPPAPAKLAKEAAADLAELLADLPDGSLERDWAELCQTMAHDVRMTPEEALRRLNVLRESLLVTGNARMWMVGSAENQKRLEAPVEALAGELRPMPAPPQQPSDGRPIDARLLEHEPAAAHPRFVGLLVPNLPGGVMVTMLPFTGFGDTSRDALLDLLAAKLFSGGGAHSVFTKTVGAGLAYSNGILASLRQGYAGYYAERMPEIPQTLHFAIDVVKKGPRSESLAEYAIAQVFQDSQAYNSYEERAQGIADDLADGITPDRVKAFRQAVLALRREPDLARQLFARVDAVYGRILPGYGAKAKQNGDAVYFIFGNDKQFSALDADTWAREDEHVYRLYPRDFWLVDRPTHKAR